VLELIRQAKERDHPWADGALAQIGALTGLNYAFKRTVRFDFIRYEIEVQP
jgi:hypothetical protein